MVRIATCLLGLSLVSVSALPVRANWWTGFWGDVKTTWHRNNQWPEPFIEPDRASVRAPVSVMVERGWQRQNLLGDHHFENGTNQLTQAGKLRVKAILANSPPQFRTFYVERGDSQDITASRIDAVQQAIVGYVPEGALPGVLASDMMSEGWSSEYADAVTRRYSQTIPSPRLPKSYGSVSGGGGNPGGAGTGSY